MDNHLDSEGMTSYECDFCQNRFGQFIPWPDKFDFPQAQYEMWNKQTAICPHCYSMDRERLYRYYIEKETELLTGPRSVFHIAIERSLRNWLMNKHNIQYVGGYVTSEKGMRQFDLTSVGYPDETFDAVICSHVFEHLTDDVKAMKEMYRIMKKDGWGIMQVPISLQYEKTKEDPAAVTPEQRFRAFGQEDHYRIYAKQDYVQRLESAGFNVEQIRFAQTEIMKYGLSQRDVLYVVTKNHGSAPLQSSNKDESKQASWFNKIKRLLGRN